MVTVTPHLIHAIGVLAVSEDPSRGVFTPLLAKDTAAPCKRSAVIPAPKNGGDIIVKIHEAERDIKVTKPEAKPKVNGTKKDAGAGGQGNDADDDFSDDDEDDEEPEDVREKIWKVGRLLAEAGVKDIKKGGKIEVTINVAADLGTQVTAREVGGKRGVRGALERPQGVENGSA